MAETDGKVGKARFVPKMPPGGWGSVILPGPDVPTMGHDVPDRWQWLAAEAVKSRASAVKLFCLECVGYSVSDVRHCTATKCPLFHHRPYKVAGDDDA